ncbi:twin-arginine translocation signal domain-containing protein [Psychromarinibacter sp. C21-152]|uniref:Twin-arginine translocation signal domain-containing protein n=1 Tax=Psychromarinibacter sediminicola TaxID=3033385 RepID=A0AAE3NS02_9RHOB|nr:twin-arginine translocation signal domain-containing protein [Psychromarinibacter sediminicola]MDF0603213.1 twin-arginine translocation signal domain-containing protein [Psychromarinibacter sediminicola]
MTRTRQTPTRRTLLKGGAALGAATILPTPFINHAWAQDVSYDGGVFDAEGATLNVGEWGGGWEEFVRQALTDDFEKDFNCTVNWDSSFPWFPKFVTQGAQNPVFDICNWNLPNLTQTKQAGDFFLTVEEIRENVPNADNCWDFAFASGAGVTWAYMPYVYAYRTDTEGGPVDNFRAFWEPRFSNKRGAYGTENGLMHAFFMATAKEFGEDQYDMQAAFQALEDAMPMKISEFTFNMLSLIERGEVDIAVHIEGEALSLKRKGVPMDVWLWDSRPILTQTKTISRYSDPVQKKLAFALLNRTLSPEFLNAFGDEFLWRPTNSEAKITDQLAEEGVENTADAVEAFWVPDWDFFVENKLEITDRLNQIFGL